MNSPQTGAPTLREALAELVALQDRSPGAIWPGVWERGRAALSAPPAGAPTRLAAKIKALAYEMSAQDVACVLSPPSRRDSDAARATAREFEAAVDALAALSAQAPPSETVDRALNVFHEYAESQARAGAQAPPAPLASWDERALKAAHAISLMWGENRSQFVSRIHCEVLEAMRWAGTPQAAIGAPRDTEFERGWLAGRDQERALWNLAASSQEIDAAIGTRSMSHPWGEPDDNSPEPEFGDTGHPAQAVASGPASLVVDSTESDAEAVQRAAVWKERKTIIEALAGIVNVPTPDKLFDQDAIPRVPVMVLVGRITEATYRLSQLAETQRSSSGAMSDGKEAVGAPVEPLPLTDDELRQHITDERARNKAQMRIDSGRAGSPDPSLPPPKETP